MHYNRLLDAKISNIYNSVEEKVNENLVTIKKSTEESGGSWKIPFLILGLLSIITTCGVYLAYKALIKKHLL